MKWGDAEAAQISLLITSGALRNVERMSLSYNHITDVGMATLAQAVRDCSAEALASIQHAADIELDGNPGNSHLVYEALRERGCRTKFTPEDLKRRAAYN